MSIYRQCIKHEQTSKQDSAAHETSSGLSGWVIEMANLDRADERERQTERDRCKFQHRVENPVEHPDGWDSLILDFFIRQPGAVVLFMRAVNSLVKHFRAGCKRDRERAKIIIIRAMGRLIRQGRLKRVRRCFVWANEAEVPHKPVIPLGVALPKAGVLEPTAARPE
jgi:hypothetical protein